MIRIFFILFQFIFLLIIAAWAINNSYSVSFTFRDVIITTSTSVLVVGVLIIVVTALFLQRIVFFLKQSSIKFKTKRELSIYKKGYNSFLQGMVAIANKDFKKAIEETKKVNKYFKDESLSLLLKAQTLKIEKKFDDLNEVYEKMLKDNNTNSLGLRGLMELNLNAQDYHHAFIYGEKLFNINPKINKLYDTLMNVIGKTNNWQKLIEVNEKAFKEKIIDKKTYRENKSIGFYEIAKIKQHSSENEAINLIEKALKLRDFFSPYVSLYINLLIESNKLKKAKNFLYKVWNASPHPDLKKEIKILAKAMEVSYHEIAQSIAFNTSNNLESKILLTESLIESQKWQEARNQISSLLEHKPMKEVCLLMALIEEGEFNDPQKINSWISRSNSGKLNKIWVCRISGTSQKEWTSVSDAGYFNSLEWKFPSNIGKINSLGFEDWDSVEYIEN